MCTGCIVCTCNIITTYNNSVQQRKHFFFFRNRYQISPSNHHNVELFQFLFYFFFFCADSVNIAVLNTCSVENLILYCVTIFFFSLPLLFDFVFFFIRLIRVLHCLMVFAWFIISLLFICFVVCTDGVRSGKIQKRRNIAKERERRDREEKKKPPK